MEAVQEHQIIMRKQLVLVGMAEVLLVDTVEDMVEVSVLLVDMVELKHMEDGQL